MRKNVFYTLLMMVLVLFFTKYNIQANTGKPAKPVIQSVKSNDVGKIQVKYREVSGVNGYQIMLSENQKFTSGNIIVTVKSGKIPSKKISKLKKYLN